MKQGYQFSESSLPLFSIGEEDEASHATPLNAAGRLPSYITDHRQRLRERFRETEGAGLAEYELLEMVLFRAIARQDVKPLARRLLDAFGDLARVVSAPRAFCTSSVSSALFIRMSGWMFLLFRGKIVRNQWAIKTPTPQARQT